MSRGVIYLFTGSKHAVVAAVSLMTLRDWWDGPVSLFCDESAMPFAGPIAEAAKADIIPYQPVSLKRHSGFYNKTILPSLSPFEQTIQLDLDTTVVGEFGELWPQQDDEFVLTQFAGWYSDGKKVNGRIGWWEKAAPKLVADKRANPGPALNTGCVAYGPDSWLAKRVWREVTELNLGQFLGDEQAADLMTGQAIWTPYIRILDDRWNWSPVYSEDNDDKRVIHSHGSKAFKRQRAFCVWYPCFARALESNFGGICDWEHQCSNKRYRRLVRDNPGILKSGFDYSKLFSEEG